MLMLNVLLLFLYLNLCSVCCYIDCFDTEICPVFAHWSQFSFVYGANNNGERSEPGGGLGREGARQH